MKIPAIRSKIGTWPYYVSSLTFEEVSKYVKRVDNELHQSEALRDQLQRAITDNYLGIKNYIHNQEDRFFNSLVLAVYDGDPKWIEIEVNYGEKSYYNIGFLELASDVKIFPVDGQHRVEGIKSALKDNPDLSTESVPVILIGHKNNLQGMQKTRRLFTTLNRYARPVKLNDIIALDEDDSVALATRDLLENFDLFTINRVNNSEQKAIPESDKNSLTSIITLYQCNLEIYKLFLRIKLGKNPTKLMMLEKQKYRPNEGELQEFLKFCNDFWIAFKNSFSIIQEYLSKEENPAAEFRNSVNGGNLIFRPIGLLPLIQVAVDIHSKTGSHFDEIFNRFDEIELSINQRPWKHVMWNPYENSMIMGNSALIKLLLKFLYQKDLISNNEHQKLITKYGSATNNVEGAEEELLAII